MKSKTDENLPLQAAVAIREAGFDVESVWDEALSGASEERIASAVQDEQRVFITLDLDFANIRCYPPECYTNV